MQLNLIDVLLLYYSHQHASATHVAIFRVISLRKSTITQVYKNTKEKLLQRNATTWFNKMCQLNQQIPKYINITIKGKINKVLILKEWP